MGRYILRRFAFSVAALWVIVTLTFLLMHSIPGDPFMGEKVTEAIRLNMLRKYGLDKPLWQQYLVYIGNLLRGDLGISLRMTNRTVNDLIREGFPVSCVLGLEALAFAVTTGLCLGTLAGLKHNSGWDYLAIVVAIIGISVPNFITASILQYVVGYRLRLLPIARWGTFEQSIIPAFSLGLGTLAITARMMRTSILDVINQDYIRTAKAKGLSEAEITWRHTLRNAILPIVTIMGPLIAGITTGSLLIEQIFGIPGLGKYYVQSVYNRDYTLILGTTVFYATILVVMNFLVDVSYGFIDPRIRLLKGRE
ncbi:MAG TPA: ABC transporter permease [Firmicutes bacterium]|nr:ABC transporter permease [Bacillota bacterium]